MPTVMHLPTDIDPDTDYVVVVTRLRVRTLRSGIRFFRALGPVQTQMGSTPGLHGWALKARLLTMTFGTYGVFASRRAVADFVGSGAHREAMKALRGRMGGPTEMITTTLRGADLPQTWPEIDELLASRTLQQAT